MSKSTGVIFLDIDGVVIPATALLANRMATVELTCSPLHVNIVKELCLRTGAKIVTHTTHNRSEDPSIKDQLIKAGLDESFFHEDWRTDYPGKDRRDEGYLWLERHPEVTHWVALDDIDWADGEHQVIVDGDYGLSIANLNQALAYFGKAPVFILV